MKIRMVLCLMFLTGTLAAQEQLVHRVDTLKTVTVKDARSGKAEGSTQNLPTILIKEYNQSALPQLLQLHSNVFVKNYGVSNLSTISIRGSSAAQTSVTWNGLHINQALTGLTDFSTLPVSLFDQMSIRYGSSMGQAQISGTVQLDNEAPDFSHRISARVGMGYESIGNASLNGIVKISRPLFSNSTRFSVSGGANRYSFYNEDTEQQDTLHAQQGSANLMNDCHVRLSRRSILSVHTWLQQSQREIPAASFEPNSVKEENIQAWRNQVIWKRSVDEGLSWHHSVGLLYETYRYSDESIGVKQDANSLSVPVRLAFTLPLPADQRVELSLSGSHQRMLKTSDSALNKAGLSLSYCMDKLLKRGKVQARLQYEVTDVFQLPLAAQVNAEYKVFRNLSVYGGWSKTYRMPTLNELYYQPGGNIRLKPETGNNLEGGLLAKRGYGQWQFEADAAVFSRRVKNWIVWYGNAILTPHNIQEVYSHGTEVQLQGRYYLQPMVYPAPGDQVEIARRTQRAQDASHLSLNLLYAYTLSTTEASELPNDYSIGRQLPYVPRYQLKIDPGFVSRHVTIRYIFTYTGYRFVTTDESQWLMPYRTHNLLWSSAYVFHNTHSLQLTLRVNNLLGENYQSMVGRYMPGRNASVGLVYGFR